MFIECFGEIVIKIGINRLTLIFMILNIRFQEMGEHLVLVDIFPFVRSLFGQTAYQRIPFLKIKLHFSTERPEKKNIFLWCV